MAAGARAQTLGFENNLYNTGYNGNTLEATGSGIEDTHYTLVFPTGPAFTGPVFTGYVGFDPSTNSNVDLPPSPTSPTATEITPSPTATSYANGLYVFQLALTNLTVGQQYTITGKVAGDDSVTTIGANGSLVSIPVTTSFDEFVPFTLTFTAGATNDVDFTVNNTGGFTGLLVDQLAGSATPEPSVWALLAGGFGTILLLRSRRTSLRF